MAFLLFSFGNHLFAQDNPDAIALVDDQLENNFYEAVKQRGIENYDKAIVAIQKCIEKDSKNAAFQYELGKNYLSLKNLKTIVLMGYKFKVLQKFKKL